MTATTGTPFLRPDNNKVLVVPIALAPGQGFAGAVNLPGLQQTLDSLLPGLVERCYAMIDISDGVTTYENAVGIQFYTTPTTQEQSDAAGAVAAHNPSVLTPEQQAVAYMAQNLEYKDIFIAASNTLEVGIATLNPVTLAAYRTVLTNTLTALAPLAGTRFETHFNLERQAQSLSGAVSGMTLTQCAAFDQLMHTWLNARKVDVLLAHTGIWQS